MARLVFSPRALEDIDRLCAFLLEQSGTLAAETAPLIVEGLAALKRHPLLGRPVEHGLRELMISRGRTGYIALYRYLVEAEAVVVLRVVHQRESARE